jgi:hypothetical protein
MLRVSKSLSGRWRLQTVLESFDFFFCKLAYE